MSQWMADRKMNESFQGLKANSITDVVAIFKMQLKIPAKITYCVLYECSRPPGSSCYFAPVRKPHEEAAEGFIFAIGILLLLMFLLSQCLWSKLQMTKHFKDRCQKTVHRNICRLTALNVHTSTSWTARWLLVLSVLFSLIFPSRLTQFNSSKTRVQLWENSCPLCAPISTVHIWVQIRAWIMQLPPTWTLLVPVCLTAVGMTRSALWILNAVGRADFKKGPHPFAACWMCVHISELISKKRCVILQRRRDSLTWSWFQSGVTRKHSGVLFESPGQTDAGGALWLSDVRLTKSLNFHWARFACLTFWESKIQTESKFLQNTCVCVCVCQCSLWSHAALKITILPQSWMSFWGTRREAALPANLHVQTLHLFHLLKYILLKQTNNPPPNYCLHVNNYSQDNILNWQQLLCCACLKCNTKNLQRGRGSRRQ